MKRFKSSGNRQRLERHAHRIVQNLMSGDVTLMGVMRTYRVAYTTARAFILERIGAEEWAAICHRNRNRGNRRTRFKKGHPTWNAGLKGLHLHPETEFKKGCMRGQAARNWRPLGTIAVRRDHLPRRLQNRRRKGGLPWPRRTRRFVKVRDFGPTARRWVPVARWYWEMAYGPIPPGMCVVYADGDSMNDSLANYRLVDRADHLAIQEANDRRMRERCTRAASRATRRRHAETRAAKAAVRAAGAARRNRPPRIVGWECPDCGGTCSGTEAPDRCGHCGGGTFVAIERAGAA